MKRTGKKGPRAFNRKLREGLGERIRLRREELAWTQRYLTKRAGLADQRHIWGFEHGRGGMTIETARRIALALGWSLSRLFKGL